MKPFFKRLGVLLSVLAGFSVLGGGIFLIANNQVASNICKIILAAFVIVAIGYIAFCLIVLIVCAFIWLFTGKWKYPEWLR